jgi:hypothetical protein
MVHDEPLRRSGQNSKPAARNRMERASRKVRSESMRINAEFAAIEGDIDDADSLSRARRSPFKHR